MLTQERTPHELELIFVAGKTMLSICESLHSAAQKIDLAAFDKKAGIKGSTINLTVVAAKDQPELAAQEAKVARRSVAWTKVINRKSYVAADSEESSTTGEWDEVEIVVDSDLIEASQTKDIAAPESNDEAPVVFFEPKRTHYSRKSTLVRA